MRSRTSLPFAKHLLAITETKSTKTTIILGEKVSALVSSGSPVPAAFKATTTRTCEHSRAPLCSSPFPPPKSRVAGSRARFKKTPGSARPPDDLPGACGSICSRPIWRGPPRNPGSIHLRSTQGASQEGLESGSATDGPAADGSASGRPPLFSSERAARRRRTRRALGGSPGQKSLSYRCGYDVAS